MAKKPAPTWDTWNVEVFGDPYMVWHDGVDWSLVDQAYREDPELMEAMLIEGVEAEAAIAAASIGRLLAAGREVPQALERLQAYNNSPSAPFALRRAETLFNVTGDPAHRTTMLGVLTGAHHWSVRIEAAMAIGNLKPSLEAIVALQSSAASEDRVLRFHSADALLKYPGAGTETPQLFRKLASPGIKGEPTSIDRAGWREVAAKLATNAMRALDTPPASR